jgi:hypothetical protein
MVHTSGAGGGDRQGTTRHNRTDAQRRRQRRVALVATARALRSQSRHVVVQVVYHLG